MFYDGWIKFLHENYLFLAVCICLNLSYLKAHTFGDFFNSTLAFVLGLGVVAFPIYIGLFYNLKKNRSLIEARDHAFFSKFGSAISDLNFKQKGFKVLISRIA